MCLRFGTSKSSLTSNYKRTFTFTRQQRRRQGQIETLAIVFYISVYIYQIWIENVPVRQVDGQLCNPFWDLFHPRF